MPMPSPYKTRIPVCAKENCPEPPYKARKLEHRFCPPHFDEAWLDPSTPITHRHLTKFGYVMVTVMGRPVREHRLAMERHLGRRLTDRENVHHIDGDKTNNVIGNLELWLEDQPSGQRVSDKIKWALEIIEQYGDNPSAF